MNSQFNEISQIRDRFYFKITLFYVGVISLVILLGLYVGSLFFGVNSLRVLWSLEAKKGEFQEQVYQLRRENALLQKEYFELKGLEPK